MARKPSASIQRLLFPPASGDTASPRDHGIAQSQLRDYQARLGQEFVHREYLDGLTGLRDQLRCALSGAAPAAEGQPQPDASELAERIKALKAENTIEAAPARTGKPHSTAEEPVTARIRRRGASNSDASNPSAPFPPEELTGPALPAEFQPASDPGPDTPGEVPNPEMSGVEQTRIGRERGNQERMGRGR